MSEWDGGAGVYAQHGQGNESSRSRSMALPFVCTSKATSSVRKVRRSGYAAVFAQRS